MNNINDLRSQKGEMVGGTGRQYAFYSSSLVALRGEYTKFDLIGRFLLLPAHAGKDAQ